MEYKNRSQLNIDDDENIIIHYNAPLIADKAIQEFQGMASMIILDGEVDDKEIDFLLSWAEKYQSFRHQWPLSQLESLIQKILSDGIVTMDERMELLDFLSSIAADPGGDQNVKNIFTKNIKVTFPEKNFLFTGKLQFGTRRKAENEVEERGGFCLNYYSRHDLNYLVVGCLGTDAWKFSRFGRKIESCMNDIEDRRTKAKIIKEKDFIRAVVEQPA